MSTKFNLPHLDAAENVFFQRELEQILAEQFDIQYVPLMARKLVPVDNSIDPAAETVGLRQFDKMGEAKAISDYADDFPMVGVEGTEGFQRIQSYGDGFMFSIQEIRAAAKVGRPLERWKAQAARAVLDQKLDSIAATGDSAYGLTGLLNLSNTLTYTTPTGANGAKDWASKTPDEILADMSGVVKKIRVDSKGVESPKRLILPLDQYELIAHLARSDKSDVTVLNFFKATHPDIEVMSWERLDGAGAASSDRMVAYDPNPVKLRLLLPVEYEQFPPQLKNMAYIVNCHMRCGGVIAPYPKSICYADDI
jgi:hypothetical protein